VAKKKKHLHLHRLPWLLLHLLLKQLLQLLLPLTLPLLLPQLLLRKKSRNNCAAIVLNKPPSGGFFIGARSGPASLPQT